MKNHFNAIGNLSVETLIQYLYSKEYLQILNTDFIFLWH